jgi:hypothetical protein
VPSPGATFFRAIDELLAARVATDELGVRQAAEKAWLAVVEATDFYLLKDHGVQVEGDERAHAQRRRYLRQLDRGDLENSYVLLSQNLHGDIFYLGEPVSPADLRRFFLEAAEFVEKATGEGGLVDTVLRRVPPT